GEPRRPRCAVSVTNSTTPMGTLMLLFSSISFRAFSRHGSIGIFTLPLCCVVVTYSAQYTTGAALCQEIRRKKYRLFCSSFLHLRHSRFPLRGIKLVPANGWPRLQ